MTSVRRALSTQAIGFAGATGVAQLATALMYILVARNVAPTDFGLLISAIAMGTIAAGVLDFGTNSLWVRELSRDSVNMSELSDRMSAKLGFALLVSLLWTFSVWLTFIPDILLLAGPLCVAVLLFQTLTVGLRADSRAEIVGLAILLDRILTVLVMILLAYGGMPLIFAFACALPVGPILSGLLCSQVTMPTLKPRLRMPPWNVRNPWEGSTAFGVASIASTAQALDVVILNWVSGPFAAGVYGAVSKWTQPITLLINSYSLALAPAAARAESARTAFRELQSSIWVLAVALLSCVGLALTAPALVPSLLGDGYGGAGPVLALLAIGCLPAIIAQPIAVFLQSRGAHRAVAFILSFGVGVHLAVTGVAAAQVGAYGGAIGFISANLWNSVALSWLMFRVMKRHHA